MKNGIMLAVAFIILWMCTSCSQQLHVPSCTTASNHIWGAWESGVYIGNTNLFLGIPINMDKQQIRTCTVCGLEEVRNYR